MGLLMTTESGL